MQALTFPRAGSNYACNCVADTARVEVIGVGEFDVSFTGVMEVTVEDQIAVNGRATLPLRIRGHSTLGQSEGLGRVTVDRDPDRPAPLSQLQELVAGTRFPASQEMYVNILVTVGVLPGVTLRNVATGTLRNQRQESFPPKDATYRLVKPVDLEVVGKPGTVAARIVSYEAHINAE